MSQVTDLEVTLASIDRVLEAEALFKEEDDRWLSGIGVGAAPTKFERGGTQWNVAVKFVVENIPPNFIGMVNDAAQRERQKRIAQTWALLHVPDVTGHLLVPGTPHVIPSQLAAEGAKRTANSAATKRAMRKARVKEDKRRAKARQVMAQLELRNDRLARYLEVFQGIRYRRALLPRDAVIGSSYPTRMLRNGWQKYKAMTTGPMGRLFAGAWGTAAYFYTFQIVLQTLTYPLTKSFELHHYFDKVSDDIAIEWAWLSPTFAGFRWGAPYVNDRFPKLHDLVEKAIGGFSRGFKALRNIDTGYVVKRNGRRQLMNWREFEEYQESICAMPGSHGHGHAHGHGHGHGHEGEHGGESRHPRYHESQHEIARALDGLGTRWWRGDPIAAARSNAEAQFAKLFRGRQGKFSLVDEPGAAVAFAVTLEVLEQTVRHCRDPSFCLATDHFPVDVQAAMVTLNDEAFVSECKAADERFARSIELAESVEKVTLRGIKRRFATAVAGIGVVMGAVVGQSTPVEAVLPPTVSASDVQHDRFDSNSEDRAAASRAAAKALVDQQRTQHEAAVQAGWDLLNRTTISTATPDAEVEAAQRTLQQAAASAYSLGDRAAVDDFTNAGVWTRNVTGVGDVDELRKWRTFGDAAQTNSEPVAVFTNNADGSISLGLSGPATAR